MLWSQLPYGLADRRGVALHFVPSLDALQLVLRQTQALHGRPITAGPRARGAALEDILHSYKSEHPGVANPKDVVAFGRAQTGFPKQFNDARVLDCSSSRFLASTKMATAAAEAAATLPTSPHSPHCPASSTPRCMKLGSLFGCPSGSFEINRHG